MKAGTPLKLILSPILVGLVTVAVHEAGHLAAAELLLPGSPSLWEEVDITAAGPLAAVSATGVWWATTDSPFMYLATSFFFLNQLLYLPAEVLDRFGVAEARVLFVWELLVCSIVPLIFVFHRMHVFLKRGKI